MVCPGGVAGGMDAAPTTPLRGLPFFYILAPYALFPGTEYGLNETVLRWAYNCGTCSALAVSIPPGRVSLLTRHHS